MRLIKRDEEGEFVIETSLFELVGFSNSLGEALQTVGDWQIETKVGLLPETRVLRSEVLEVFEVLEASS